MPRQETYFEFSTNPSSVGTIRLGYDLSINGRTSTDGNTVQMLKASTGDIVYVGDASYGLHGRGSSIAITSTHIDLDSTRIVVGGPSTTSIERIQRYLVEWTVPAMSSGSTAAETTVTVTGLTTNSVLVLSPRVQVNSSVSGITIHPRCSTADELVLQQSKIGESSIGGSTQSAYLLQFRF